MQRFPFLSITDALGLAPPREEPGIRSSLISLKDASSSMIFQMPPTTSANQLTAVSLFYLSRLKNLRRAFV